MKQSHIETDESQDLISSDKVDGTTVYGAEGNRLGTVKNVMIGKRDGMVRHAVLSVGGFLGIGERYHIIPWPKLKYDTSLGGYRLDVTEDKLRGAPHFGSDEYDTAYSRDTIGRAYTHYGVNPYW